MVECPYSAKASNKIDKTFWGRVPIEKGVGAFVFQKDSTVQTLLHQLKYGGEKELAPWIAKFLFEKWKAEEQTQHIDLVLPVPIHPRKLRVRGYNQAALLAHELAILMQKPCLEDALSRVKQTDSQVTHTRAERMENVLGNFKLSHPDKIKEKNILLVDDMLTTGATLEACALECAPYANKIFVCTAAYAM